MNSQEIIEAAQRSIDSAMEVRTVNGDDLNDQWVAFYLGKAWAYLDIFREREKEDT